MANQNLVSEKDKFVEYKYTISEFYIIINGKTEKFPVERVGDIKIEHNFEEWSLPVFKISLQINASTYYKIIKNKDNIKFKLRMQSFYVNPDEPTDKSLLRDVINDTFVVFEDSDNNEYEENLKKQTGKIDDTDSPDDADNIVEFFLFKEFITNLRSTINVLLKDCDMTTAIAYLLNKANVKNVLMSPLDNKETYEQLLLPPQSIDKQLQYLNNNYGFHKNGTVIYFGLLYSYILDYKNTCTAWYKNEWTDTIIYVLDKTNKYTKYRCAIMKSKEKKYYCCASTDGIDTSSGSISENVINGTDISVVDVYTNSSSELESGSKVVGKANTKILYNTTSNTYMSTTYLAQQKANSVTISIVIENMVLEAFNPNKIISIIFEDSKLNAKYKGKYKVANAIHTFAMGGDDYRLTSTLYLKKVD